MLFDRERYTLEIEQAFVVVRRARVPMTLAEFAVEVEQRNRSNPRHVPAAEVAKGIVARWKADRTERPRLARTRWWLRRAARALLQPKEET